MPKFENIRMASILDSDLKPISYPYIQNDEFIIIDFKMMDSTSQSKSNNNFPNTNIQWSHIFNKMMICGYSKYFQLEKQSIMLNLCDSHLKIDSILSYSTYCDHTVFVNLQNKGHCFGFNEDGRINGDLPPKVFAVEQEIKLKDSDITDCEIRSAVCGEFYTLYLISSIKPSNQLVYVHKNYKNGKPIFINVDGNYFKNIYGGQKTSAAIDSRGRIAIITESFLKNTDKLIETFVLPDKEKAISIACCNNFIIAVSSAGKIFELKIKEEEISGQFEPVFEIFKMNFVYVSGTSNHCFAVCADGRVFGKGLNYCGQLGIGNSQLSTEKFVEITSLNKYKIVSVSAGFSHSLFITNEKKILSCGSNDYGELLIKSGPSVQCVFLPVEIEIEKNALFCIAGYHLSVVFFGLDKSINFESIEQIEHEEEEENIYISENDPIEESEKEEVINEIDIDDLKIKYQELKEENVHLKSLISYKKEQGVY